MAQEVLSHRKVIVEDTIEMTDLAGLAKSLEATAKTCPQNVKKTKTHERRSRRLGRESDLLQSVGASSLQDGTMERLAHCYPGYRKCIMCVVRLSRYALFTFLIFIFACLAGPSALLLLTTKLQGFILGALANVHLTHQFGFGKVGIGADLKRFEIWVLT